MESARVRLGLKSRCEWQRIPGRFPQDRSSRRAGSPLMLRERTGENLYLCDDFLDGFGFSIVPCPPVGLPRDTGSRMSQTPGVSRGSMQHLVPPAMRLAFI